MHKSIPCSLTLVLLLPKACTLWGVCERVFTDMVVFVASVRRYCKQVHVNIYIGFRKQLLLRKNLFLFTKIQNKETLLQLPVIDMWACFSSH